MKNLFSIFKSSAFWTVVAGTVVGIVVYNYALPMVKGLFARKTA